VDFKNTILIMTSNIGTREFKPGGGFGFSAGSSKDAYSNMKSAIEEALKRVFNPEFLNRIDDTIIFHQLERQHILDIVQIQMRELLKRISSMGISVDLTKQAKEFLAEKGYDPAFGARPLRRALQKYLEDPIAEELLKGKYPEGTTIRVSLNKKTGELKFRIVSADDKDGPIEEEEKPASAT
jgi:ATP-dependent Clp protease ATP-binding subunit ClpC